LGTPLCGLEVGDSPQLGGVNATSLKGRSPPVRDEETSTAKSSGALIPDLFCKGRLTGQLGTGTSGLGRKSLQLLARKFKLQPI
jgi:hypothetical protein